MDCGVCAHHLPSYHVHSIRYVFILYIVHIHLVIIHVLNCFCHRDCKKAELAGHSCTRVKVSAKAMENMAAQADLEEQPINSTH